MDECQHFFCVCKIHSYRLILMGNRPEGLIRNLEEEEEEEK
jgi:hypothetical protein